MKRGFFSFLPLLIGVFLSGCLATPPEVTFIENAPEPTPNAPTPTPNGPFFQTLWTNNDWTALDPRIEATGSGSTITIGSSTVIRSAGSQSVRYNYIPNYSNASSERVELHTKRNFLGMGEGDIVYFGWSDYYATMPMHPYTVFQWRDQDIIAGQSGSYTGCPVIGMEIATNNSPYVSGTINGIIVRIKEGYAGAGVILPNMQASQWYDFVIAIKFAKDSTGFFTAWAGPAGSLNYASPSYTYTGATMYNLADMTPDGSGNLPTTSPCGYNGPLNEDHFNSPQLRMGGAYMWGTKAPFESYKGPLRIYIGTEGKPSYDQVVPRN